MFYNCSNQSTLELIQNQRVANWFLGIRDLAYFEGKGDKTQDCNYDRDTRFGDFNKRESGNVALKKLRFGNSRD